MKKKEPKIIKEIKQKRPKEIDYSFQKNISFSQLSMYNQCPHKWKLIYKDKVKVFTSSIHTVFGTSIHETIQEYLTKVYQVSGAEADRMDLNELFEEKFKKYYQEKYSENNSQHFSSPEEMREFYDDGVAILDFIKKKRTAYFGGRGWKLIDCELPILLPPLEQYPNLLFMGYLDLVLYHEKTNTVKIIDIKTSTRSWSDSQKKDPSKINQLLLYKQYFSDQYNIPIDDIEIEFFIVKRKLPENSLYGQNRVQLFIPASGNNKLKQATSSVDNFITECFDINNTIKEKEYPKKPSNFCKWCPFGPDFDKC